MWGEDSSGRKVSLLNSDHSSPPPPPPPLPPSRYSQTSKLTRPTLPDRSAHSNFSSSTSVASCASFQSCSSRSSISRSPGHSPPTPPLTRLDSLSSISTKSKPSSPMTPNYGYEPLDSAQNKQMNVPYYHHLGKAQGFSSAQDAPVPNPYYHLPGQQPLPPIDPLSLEDNYSSPNALHRLQTQHISPFSTDPSLHQLSPTSQNSAHLISPASSLLPSSTSTFAQPPTLSHSSSATASASSPTSKTSPTASKAAPSTPNSANNGLPKKKYPCPHASTYNCSDTFTTSGHAARHGKKHTGEKNVHCPTCGKAFTRKDNMKQHERTHKGGTAHSTPSSVASISRGPSGGSSGGISGSASPASVTKTPVAGNTSHMRQKSDILRSGSGTPSATKRASPTEVKDGDAMDIDTAASSMGMNRGGMMAPMVPQMAGANKNERPKIQRSELSEILETVQNGGVVSPSQMDSLADADAEGESPGLDALAMAAGAVV